MHGLSDLSSHDPSAGTTFTPEFFAIKDLVRAGRAGRTFAEEEVTSIVDALSSSVNLLPVCVSACTDRNRRCLVGARILRPIGRTMCEPSHSGRLMCSAAWEDRLRRGNPHHRV